MEHIAKPVLYIFEVRESRSAPHWFGIAMRGVPGHKDKEMPHIFAFSRAATMIFDWQRTFSKRIGTEIPIIPRPPPEMKGSLFRKEDNKICYWCKKLSLEDLDRYQKRLFFEKGLNN